MAGSVAVAVRKAVIGGLATHLGALSDFNGTSQSHEKVCCSYGYDRTEDPAERVFTDRASGATPPAALRSGRNYRNEVGEFDLVILVAGLGMSPEEVDQRAAAIGAEAEEWIADRKNNELGVTGLQTLKAVRWESANLGNDLGNLSELRIAVEYTARLT